MVKMFNIIRKYICHPEPKNILTAHKRYSFEPAFTLAEVLIAMLIMSIFFMATTKVISVKQKPIIQEYPHGYYECYNFNGLKEHRVDAGHETIPLDSEVGVGACIFRAPKGQPVFNVYVVTNNAVYTTTETQITNDEVVIPNAAGLINLYADTMDTEEERNKAFYGNIYERWAQLRNYLNNSYPGSALGSRWSADSVAPPFNAIFITW